LTRSSPQKKIPKDRGENWRTSIASKLPRPKEVLGSVIKKEINPIEPTIPLKIPAASYNSRIQIPELLQYQKS